MPAVARGSVSTIIASGCMVAALSSKPPPEETDSTRHRNREPPPRTVEVRRGLFATPSLLANGGKAWQRMEAPRASWSDGQTTRKPACRTRTRTASGAQEAWPGTRTSTRASPSLAPPIDTCHGAAQADEACTPAAASQEGLGPAVRLTKGEGASIGGRPVDTPDASTARGAVVHVDRASTRSLLATQLVVCTCSAAQFEGLGAHHRHREIEVCKVDPQALRVWPDTPQLQAKVMSGIYRRRPAAASNSILGRCASSEASTAATKVDGSHLRAATSGCVPTASAESAHMLTSVWEGRVKAYRGVSYSSDAPPHCAAALSLSNAGPTDLALRRTTAHDSFGDRAHSLAVCKPLRGTAFRRVKPRGRACAQRLGWRAREMPLDREALARVERERLPIIAAEEDCHLDLGAHLGFELSRLRGASGARSDGGSHVGIREDRSVKRHERSDTRDDEPGHCARLWRVSVRGAKIIRAGAREAKRWGSPRCECSELSCVRTRAWDLLNAPPNTSGPSDEQWHSWRADGRESGAYPRHGVGWLANTQWRNDADWQRRGQVRPEAVGRPVYRRVERHVAHT
eukprot:scaffold65690_cov29-Tisochrysis_lutea.AAC.4